MNDYDSGDQRRTDSEHNAALRRAWPGADEVAGIGVPVRDPNATGGDA